MSCNVLIIEDDSSFRKLLEVKLKSFLEEPSFTHFSRISEAREFLQKGNAPHFSLVVLDQNLPDGKGISLLQEGLLAGLTVLAMSSDDDPQMPGANISAGAAYFLGKSRISEPLFKPLVLGIIDRNRLQTELSDAKLQLAIMDTVKTLVSTLKHEINNPLGAVLGAAYLLKSVPNSSKKEVELAELVESSGARIKAVMDQLSEAVSVKPVMKANHKVFHIPGDKPWEDEK